MPVLKVEHRMAHLETEAEKATFAKTAPIMTEGYWDLVDAVRNPQPERQAVRETYAEVAGELAVKAETSSSYQAQLGQTTAIMEQELDNII